MVAKALAEGFLGWRQESTPLLGGQDGREGSFGTRSPASGGELEEGTVKAAWQSRALRSGGPAESVDGAPEWYAGRTVAPRHIIEDSILQSIVYIGPPGERAASRRGGIGARIHVPDGTQSRPRPELGRRAASIAAAG